MMTAREAIQDLGTRWAPLIATTNSGKAQWACLVCGRVSPTPDKRCEAPPHLPEWMRTEQTRDCAEYERWALDQEPVEIEPGTDAAKRQLAMMEAIFGMPEQDIADQLGLNEKERAILEKRLRDPRFGRGG